jgi:hypothetical protein
MLGRRFDAPRKLFYTRLSLEKRIRKDHLLKKIATVINFDFDDDIPIHGVLFTAPARRGVYAFKYFFERIVFQCAQSGLIDGSKKFTGTGMVPADASNNAVVNQCQYLRERPFAYSQDMDINVHAGEDFSGLKYNGRLNSVY